MTTGNLNPLEHPQAYDVVILGGQTSPGVIKRGGIAGFKRAHQWDKKKGKGALGETLTYVQRPAAQGTITFTLGLPEHFAAWEDFRPLFKYDPTKQNPQALDIFHPVLADLDIHSVVCESISQLEDDGYGEWHCTVELCEYFPPPKKPAVGTPTTSQTNGAPAGAGNNPQPAVQDAQQQEIQRLLDEASAP